MCRGGSPSGRVEGGDGRIASGTVEKQKLPIRHRERGRLEPGRSRRAVGVHGHDVVVAPLRHEVPLTGVAAHVAKSLEKGFAALQAERQAVGCAVPPTQTRVAMRVKGGANGESVSGTVGAEGVGAAEIDAAEE